MVGTNDDDIPVRQFLSELQQVAIDAEIAERTVILRRKHRMRLPDAIICTSAQCLGLLLVTRNSKDFSQTDLSVRIPYLL